MATHWTLPRKDLFEPSPPVTQLTETERRKALDLLQALLVEAMNRVAEKARENRPEACDDLIAPNILQTEPVGSDEDVVLTELRRPSALDVKRRSTTARGSPEDAERHLSARVKGSVGLERFNSVCFSLGRR